MGDAPFCSFCFHDSAISVVDGHMSGITDHITCFCFRQARNCCTHASPSCRCGITTTVGIRCFSESDIQNENNQYHLIRELPPHTYGLPTNCPAYATIELPDAPLLLTEPELPVELLLSELLPELAVLLLLPELPELGSAAACCCITVVCCTVVSAVSTAL